MTPRRSICTALVSFFLLFSASAYSENNDPAEDPVDQILKLRSKAAYESAAELAQQLLDSRTNDDEAKPHEIRDAQMLVEMARFAAALPGEVQRRLGHADSLDYAIESFYMQGQFENGVMAAKEQMAIRQELLGGDHPLIGESLNNLAILVQRQGKYAEAEPLYREALAIQKAYFGEAHPNIASFLNNIGGLLQQRGSYGDAEGHFRQALDLRRALLGEDQLEVLQSVNNLAEILTIQGKFAEAEPSFREVVDLSKKLFEQPHPFTARSLNNLADLANKLGRYAEAEAVFQEALLLSRKLHGDVHPDVAQQLNNLAAALKSQGKNAEAEPLYREALEIRLELYGDEHRHVASTLGNLASLLMSEGDYVGAEPLFQKALAMRRKLLGEEHPIVGLSLHLLATLLEAQGKNAEAEPLAREALAIRRKALGENHPETAQSTIRLAGIVKDRGDYVEAERLFREALAINRKAYSGEHYQIGISMNALARLLREKGEPGEAERLHREALDLFRRLLGNEHPVIARSLQYLADHLESEGRLAEAVSLNREALAITRKLYGEEHPDGANILHSLGRCLLRQGNDASAEEHLLRAAQVYEAARLRAGAALERATFQRGPYETLAAAQLRLGKNEEAWPSAEKALARSLADLLRAADQRELLPAEAASEDSLAHTLAVLEGELTALREAAAAGSLGIDDRRVEETRTGLIAATAEWGIFRREITARYPITEGEVLTLHEVQALLGENTGIIGWLAAGEGTEDDLAWGYVIRKEGPVLWAPLKNAAREGEGLMSCVRSYRAGISNFRIKVNILTHEASTIWWKMIGPINPFLDGLERIVVIPSGPMIGIPVGTLVDDSGELFGDRYSISYTPSATIHSWLARRAENRSDTGTGKTLLLGDPPFCEEHLADLDDKKGLLSFSLPLLDLTLMRSALAGEKDALHSLPRLPATRYEVRSITPLAGEASILLGRDASEQAFVRLAESGELSTFRTIHLATHALVDNRQPERSALVLSQVDLPDPLQAAIEGTRIYNGLLTAEEIVREWKLDADLVTLSACETGLGRKVQGEGYVGFAHAFLQAGARSLLVSLWKVQDQATSLLMQRFYENLWGKYDDERMGSIGIPMAKVKALQEAKRWLHKYTDDQGEKPFAHPNYWSAFILIGDPN